MRALTAPTPLIQLCAALLFAHSAIAQETMAQHLARYDQNDDRRVSLAEYQDRLSFAFVEMDRNNDRVLDVDEQPGNRPKRLSWAEHLARLARQFRKQDVNRDGYLSAKELAAPPR